MKNLIGLIILIVASISNLIANIETYNLTGKEYNFFFDTVNEGNTAIDFDGIDDYIEFNSPYTGDQGFTIEMWINSQSISSGTCSNNSSLNLDWILAFEDNNLGIVNCDGGLRVIFRPLCPFGNGLCSSLPTMDISDNQWHHIAISEGQSTGFRVYFDGERFTNFSEDFYNLSGLIRLGSQFGNAAGNKYKGSMDEVRLWDFVRSDEQIFAEYNCKINQNTEGLVTYFDFSGGIPFGNNQNIDVIENRVDPINSGMLNNFSQIGKKSNFTFGPDQLCIDCIGDSETTCVNAVMNFDGIDDNILVRKYSPKEKYSIGCWFKTSENNGGVEDRLFSFGNNSRLELGVSVSGNFWLFDEQFSSIPTEYSFVRDGNWHHGAIIIDGMKRFIYLDFELVGEYDSGTDEYGPNMRVGAWAPGGSDTNFAGSIEDLKAFVVPIIKEELCTAFASESNVYDQYLEFFFNFNDGMGNSNNTSIGTVSNIVPLLDGALENFSLLGNSSNFICDTINVCEEFCTTNCDPCETDTTPPILLCASQLEPYTLDDQGEFQLSLSNLNITIIEECRIATELSQSLFTCDDIGLNTVTIIVTDEGGNSNSCNVNVIIADPNSYCECQSDDVPPVISCSSEIVIYEIGDDGIAMLDLGLHKIQVFDNCQVDQITPSIVFLDCSMLTTVPTSIPITVTDFAGNSAQCEISFILLDPNGFCIPESCDETCYSGTVDLSTGINNVGQFLPIGEYVGNWQLIDGPDQNVNYPRPGYVLNPNNSWDQLPGSQYISAFPDAINNGSFDIPYLFERCFCVCEAAADIELNVSAHVDNFIDIGLYDDNGVLIEELITFQGSSSVSAFRDPAFSSITNHSLEKGTYCLRAGLGNDGSVAMGMQINAAVTNTGFVSSECCTPYAFVLGTVFQDVGCDSLSNIFEDFGLSDVEVYLIENGTIVETVLTDEFGYYVFNDVLPGNYNVTMESIPNNIPLLGGSGYDITMTSDTIIGNLDFGLCQEINECCASPELLTASAFSELNSDAIIYNMNGDIQIETPDLLECQYLSTIYWGDGLIDSLGPNDAIPSHSYNGNGVYLLSFEVSSILDNGELCQLDEINHVIIINDCTVSIDFPDQDIVTIKLYPVPFNKMINIDFSQNNSGYQLEVFDISGQLIDSIDIQPNLISYIYENQNLPTGIYLFKIVGMDGNSILQSKVIKI